MYYVGSSRSWWQKTNRNLWVLLWIMVRFILLNRPLPPSPGRCSRGCEYGKDLIRLLLIWPYLKWSTNFELASDERVTKKLWVMVGFIFHRNFWIFNLATIQVICELTFSAATKKRTTMPAILSSALLPCNCWFTENRIARENHSLFLFFAHIYHVPGSNKPKSTVS